MKTIIKILKILGYVLIGVAWTVIVLLAFTVGAMWLIGNGFQH